MAVAVISSRDDDWVQPRAQSFGGLWIQYDDRVRVPRAWTEMQSRWGVALLADLPPGRVLELCAGAGAIGLLTAVRSGRSLVQIDGDHIAVGYARRNARAAGLAHRTYVRYGDMTTVLASDEEFPLILADAQSVETSHVDEGIRTLIGVIADHLALGGAALLQVRDEAQASEVADLLTSSSLRIQDGRFVDEGGVVELRRALSLSKVG